METINFGTYQLNGPYRFESYRMNIGKLGNPRKDIAFLKEWAKQADSSWKLTTDSASALMFGDSILRVSSFTNDVLSHEINLADPAVWLMMRDAIVSCNRLTIQAACEVSDEATVYDAIKVTAMILSLFGLMCDSTERDLLIRTMKRGDLTEEYLTKHSMSITSDIINGRGMAWLRYVDNMGAIAADACGRNWRDIRNQYAAGNMVSFINYMAKTIGCDDERKALGIYDVLVQSIDEVFDEYQYQAYKRVYAGSATPVELDNFKSCYTNPNVRAFESDANDDQRGYCLRFGISSVACIVNAPEKYELQYRLNKIDKINNRG